MRMLEIDKNYVLNIPENQVADYGICTNHDFKMFMFSSANTGCHFNAFCQRMQKIGGNCICSECFAENEKFKRYGKNWCSENAKYAKSTRSLCSRIYDFSEVPTLDAKTIQNKYGVFRIESFGELNDIKDGGINQACNYLQLIIKNSEINFGWFSKRPEIISKALERLNINAPDNCNFIYSNKWINGITNNGKKFDIKKILNRFPFINGVFTVYRAKYAAENNININCGGRSCITCLKCYNAHNEIFYINEIVKKEQAEYYSLVK